VESVVDSAAVSVAAEVVDVAAVAADPAAQIPK
jgi:hypothetical protein